ncbi:MAG: hypothetical protein CSA22_02340 [Deltaproteobacteria bacterium]|nr:MAG: hypothetical protein CSA22_02340 [Deltaproteobacteria bacterium]
MRVLMHTCCGPCSIYPFERLTDEGMTVMGYYFRDNIHPFTECMKREETLKTYADDAGFKLIIQDGYRLEEFLRDMAFREGNRCRVCYHKRMSAAAHIAKRGKFDAFTTTLLYSKFQNHSLICNTAEAAGKKYGVPFLYRDFREGWKHGVDASKARGMYRQSYCGCIFSEKERYYHPQKN